MGKSQDTWNKKENEKKRQKKKKDKDAKKLERKANAKDGSSFDDMIAYVDENGNLSSTPPDPSKKKKIKEEDIQISVPKLGTLEPIDPIRNGIVTFFNDSKGYGFIRDIETQESIFVHANNLTNQIKEKDKVTFEIERGPKGLNAFNVKLV
jgi:cold shock CspA family protein